MNTLTSKEIKTSRNPNLQLPKVGDFRLKKRCLKTLNQYFTSWRLPFKIKMPENLKSKLSQVEMFPLASFLDWVVKMMLYGW